MKKQDSKNFEILFTDSKIADYCIQYLISKKLLKNFKKYMSNQFLVIRIKCKTSKKNINDILKKKFYNSYKIL